MMQTLGDLGSTLEEAGVDGAVTADFSEAFEADSEGPGVDTTPAEGGAGAIITMAGAETTRETGGTRPTEEDFPTGFAGDPTLRPNGATTFSMRSARMRRPRPSRTRRWSPLMSRQWMNSCRVAREH